MIKYLFVWRVNTAVAYIGQRIKRKNMRIIQGAVFFYISFLMAIVFSLSVSAVIVKWWKERKKKKDRNVCIGYIVHNSIHFSTSMDIAKTCPQRPTQLKFCCNKEQFHFACRRFSSEKQLLLQTAFLQYFSLLSSFYLLS